MTKSSTDKKYSLGDIGPAMTIMKDRNMLPPSADFIGMILERGGPCGMTSIKLSWDQWAVCTATCPHGEFRASSDFLNLTEAVVRALEKFQAAEHPGYCGEPYQMEADGYGNFPADCMKWEGHEGDHGEEDDE